MRVAFWVFLLMVALAPASFGVPITVMVGDNDGFGAGIPDGGDAIGLLIDSASNVFDRRSPGEVTGSDGAYITDLYTVVFPTLSAPFFPFDLRVQDTGDQGIDESDPRVSATAAVRFGFSGLLRTGIVTLDVAGHQPGGYVAMDINGLPVDFGPGGAPRDTSIRTYSLTAGQLAAANAAQEVVLNLRLGTVFGPSGGGELLAFDFFRLDGDVDPGARSGVPTPPTAALLAFAIAGLAVRKRSERRG